MRKLLLVLVLFLMMVNLAAAPVAPERHGALMAPSYSRPVSQPSVTAIVKAMCLVESDNRAHLRGRDNERGVMQLQYHEWRKGCKLLGVSWSWDQAFDRDKNIAVGTIIISQLITKYGSWEIGVRVYNAGHRGVFKLNRGNRYLNAVKKCMKFKNTSWRLSIKHKKS